MIITIKASGGYAGYEQQEVGKIDTDMLDDEQAKHIKHVINRLRESEGQIIGTDMMRYDIEIRDEQGKTQELVLLDDGDPNNPLQELLMAVA